MSTIYVSPAQLKAKRNAGQFTPTVVLTADGVKAIKAGTMKLKKGQWVLDGASGNRGQFAGVKTSMGGKRMAVRSYTPGMKFADFQKKYA